MFFKKEKIVKRYCSLLFFMLVLLWTGISGAQIAHKNVYRIFFDSALQSEQIHRYNPDIVTERYGVSLDISCTPAEARVFESLGFRIEQVMSYPEAVSAMEVPASFHDYEETKAFLVQMAAAYPSITRLDSIGRSTEDRALWALKISDNPAVDEDEPCFLAEGCIHGNEHHALEGQLNFIRYLLYNYGSDAEVTYFVDNREIWVVPLVNPDGHELNQRRSAHNVDLNRNFGYYWGFTASNYGSAPFSEPETQAIRDLVLAIKPYGSLAFHTSGRVVLYPWAYISDVLPPDLDLFMETGSILVDSINAVDPERQYELRRSGVWYWHGGEHNDWMYSQYGMLSFTEELMTSQSADSSQRENEVVLPSFRVMLRRPDIQGVTGRVTDAVTGESLEAVVKIAEIFDEEQLKPRKSEPLYGRYLRFLTPGDYTLEVYAPGYTKEMRDIAISANDPVQTIDFPLQRARDIIYAGSSVNGGTTHPGFGRLPRGDNIAIAVSARNAGFFPVENVYARISSGSPVITVVRDSVFFGTIDSAGTVTAAENFLVNVSPDAYPGTAVHLTVDFYDAADNHWQSVVTESIEFYTPVAFDEQMTWRRGSLPEAVNDHVDWQLGEPGGKTNDPPAAHSPDYVWGTDLGGSGWNGAYQSNVDNYLETPAVITSGWTNAYLQFYRWLNINSGDRAYITVNSQTVWENYNAAVSETGWSRQIIDISSIASQSDSIIVRFGLQSDGSGTNGGWNIDDIMVSRTVILSAPVDQKNRVPERFRLHQNYPNPFNSSTVITVDLPEPGHATLAVFNVLGQEIKTLAAQDFPAGVYRVTWAGDNSRGDQVAGGVYFVRILGDNFNGSIKILLLR